MDIQSFPSSLPKEFSGVAAPTESEWAQWEAKALQGPGKPFPSAGRFAAWLVLGLEGKGIGAEFGGRMTRDEVWTTALALMNSKEYSTEDIESALNGVISAVQSRIPNGNTGDDESQQPGIPQTAEDIEWAPTGQESTEWPAEGGTINVGAQIRRASGLKIKIPKLDARSIEAIIRLLIEIVQFLAKVGPDRDKVLRYVYWGLAKATVQVQDGGREPRFPDGKIPQLPAPRPQPQPVKGCAPVAALLIAAPVGFVVFLLSLVA